MLSVVIGAISSALHYVNKSMSVYPHVPFINSENRGSILLALRLIFRIVQFIKQGPVVKASLAY